MFPTKRYDLLAPGHAFVRIPQKGEPEPQTQVLMKIQGLLTGGNIRINCIGKAGLVFYVEDNEGVIPVTLPGTPWY